MGDGRHGYKGTDTSSKTGLHYYVFTLYALDMVLGLDNKKTSKGGVLREMGSVNTLGYGKLIGTYQRFNKGLIIFSTKKEEATRNHNCFWCCFKIFSTQFYDECGEGVTPLL